MIIQIGVILFILYAAVFGFHGYAMYNILRIVVTVQALIYAASFYDDNKPVSALFGIIAILFNPLIKIHFSRSEWDVLDLGTAVIFAGALAWTYWIDKQKKKEKEVREQAFKEYKQMSVKQDKRSQEIFDKNLQLEAKYHALKANYEGLQNRYNELNERYLEIKEDNKRLKKELLEWTGDEY